MPKIDEINEAMLDAFKTEGLEDTNANRLDFLIGLHDAWSEDPSTSIEKSLYVLALNLEITRLRVMIMLKK